DVKGVRVLIEGVQVNARCTGIQCCIGKIHGGSDADSPTLCFSVHGSEALHEFHGRVDAGQFAEALQAPEAGERHDTGDDRDGDPGPACTGNQVRVFVSVEEDLRDREVCAGTLLGQENFDVVPHTWRLRIPGGGWGDA